jgi:sporulation protein YlmC with PRC-barrel domain
MKIKHILGMKVVDRDAQLIGKVDDLDFDENTGGIEQIIVSHRHKIFAHDELVVSFNDIESIGDYVLLKINFKINK